MLLIQAPILSISQIQDFYSRNPLVKFIKGSSFLFLADANLNALGVDLSVTSTVWNIGGKYKINLRSGNPKAKAGDFYGHATKVNNIGTEAKLVVDVSGTKGADGKFDISKIEAMEEQSAEYLNALKQKLKKYKEAQKQTDVSFHEDRILGYKARLLEIDGTIAAQKGRLDAIKMDIDRLAPEAILDKEKNKDLEVCEREYKRTSEEVSDLEFEKSSINKILEDLEDVTTLINKNETYIVVQLLKDQLSELEHLQSAAKNDQEISAEYLSVLDDLTNTKEKDLLVDYEALVDNVQKISEELKGRLKEDKHEKSAKEFEALGGESTVIQLRQEIADLEKEFDPNEKHKVYVSEGAIEFSLNEFIHIGEIIQELTAEIRNTNKQLDTHKKALKSLGKKIEKFNEADNKLKAIEASAKSREDNLRAEFEELNDRSDVSQKDLLDLKEAISKLFSSKTKFNEANTQFEACIARKILLFLGMKC
ncbi:MAG UNVERIFIED_CONTAM: hypothetical protein LVQ98_08365 [Rickettsiaceae bacterium]|jgi:chromosome segregation ATPase